MINIEIILGWLVFAGVFILWQWSGIETERSRLQNAMIGAVFAVFFALLAYSLFVVGRYYLIPTP